MASKESNYDKTILTVAALLALGLAGYIYMLKGDFSSKLITTKNTPRDQFPEIPVQRVDAAIKNLQTVFNWGAREFEGKMVPLNKSIPIVLQDGKLFDMFVENPPLRQPMTNKFLRENELQYEYGNVGELDPDNDGFTNVEEFNKQTNPKDAKAHPPLTDKLYFKERIMMDYELELKSTEPPLIVKRNKPGIPASLIPGTPLQAPWPVDFSFDKGAAPRFTATDFTKKPGVDDKGLAKDIYELFVTDKSTGEKFVLQFKKPYNLAEYKAVLEFRIGTVQEITVKKGDNFRVSGLAATFRLLDVAEDSAKLSQLDDKGNPGKEFTVNKRPQ